MQGGIEICFTAVRVETCKELGADFELMTNDCNVHVISNYCNLGCFHRATRLEEMPRRSSTSMYLQAIRSESIHLYHMVYIELF